MSDPCVGHACDHCLRCERGRCCRTDNANYQLPAEGSWQPVYGEIGVRNTDGRRMECHACGGWYQQVGRHAEAAHDLTADEYRSAFGLSSKGLVGEGLRDDMAKRTLSRIATGNLVLPREHRKATPEQRAAWRRPAESRKVWSETAREHLLPAAHTAEVRDRIRTTKLRQSEAGMVTVACEVCGTEFQVIPHRRTRTCGRSECLHELRSGIAKTREEQNPLPPQDPRSLAARREKATAASRAAWADPERRPALLDMAKRRAESRRSPLVGRPCVVCGRVFDVPPFRVGNLTTCSPDCRHERKRQAGIAGAAGRTPEGNERIREAKRAWWAARRATP